MKNLTLSIIGAALLLCCFSSCQKAEISNGGMSVMTFSASFEQSKITRDSEGKSQWVAGDQIDIFYEGGCCPATADKSGATTTFTTDAEIPTDKSLYVAVYPSSMTSTAFDAEMVAGELQITLKESSSASTFDACAICKASTTKAGGSLAFRNICSMLKYSSTNNKVTEASLYTDKSIRRTSLTSGAGESVYYSTLALGESTGRKHIDNLGLRLTNRTNGVDYPAYHSNVNRDFVDSHIYNIGNVENKVFSDTYDGEVSSLRLMSFNILRGDQQGPEHDWSARKAACLAMLSADKPDILNLQECTPVQRRDILDNFLQYGAVGLCVNGELNASVNNVSSNSIIYNSDKLLVEDYGHYWFSASPTKANSYTWNAKKPRNLVWARFKIKGSNKRFICISMHLQNDGDLIYSDGTTIKTAADLKTYGEENRVKSVNLILEKVLPAINKGNLPVILSGDCNSDLTSEALTKLQTVFTSAASLAPSGSSDSGNTFNGFVASGKSTIDHIFSKNCEHLRYCVDRGDSYAGVTYVSDHWPVYTDFTVPEPSSFGTNLEGWSQDNIN